MNIYKHVYMCVCVCVCVCVSSWNLEHVWFIAKFSHFPQSLEILDWVAEFLSILQDDHQVH